MRVTRDEMWDLRFEILDTNYPMRNARSSIFEESSNSVRSTAGAVERAPSIEKTLVVTWKNYYIDWCVNIR